MHACNPLLVYSVGISATSSYERAIESSIDLWDEGQQFAPYIGISFASAYSIKAESICYLATTRGGHVYFTILHGVQFFSRPLVAHLVLLAQVELCAGDGAVSSALRDCGFAGKEFDVAWPGLL